MTNLELHLTNCHVYNTDEVKEKYSAGETMTVILHADKCCKFKGGQFEMPSASYYYMGWETEWSTLSDNNKIAIINLYINEGVGKIDLWAEAIQEDVCTPDPGEATTEPEPEPEPIPETKKGVKVKTFLTNCTALEDIPPTIASGETLKVTLIADEGKAFKDEEKPTISYYSAFGSWEEEYFTLESDTRANISFAVPEDITELQITANAYIVEVVTNNYGAINAYIVDNDILDKIAEKRFIENVYTNPTTGEQIKSEKDLGTLIHSIKKCFVSVPKGLSDVIRLGNTNTNIKAFQPKDVEYIFDFGSCNIPMINDNTLDYDTNIISVFLPFAGFIDLDGYVLGKDIKLSLKLNIINSTAVYIIECENIVVKYVDVNIFDDIIYKTTSEERINGDVGNNSGGLYELTPYVIYTYKNEIKPETTEENRIFNNSFEVVQIKDIKGEIKGDLLPTTFKPKGMTTEEYNELKRIINEGVIYE